MQGMEAKRFLPEEDILAVPFGFPVPLNLQVCDGRDDLQPVVTILDPAGSQLAEVPLTHFRNGFYASNQLPMPEHTHIFAQYVIKKNGQILMDYEIVTEVFYGRQALPDEPKWVHGWVTSEEQDTGGFIIGHETTEA